MLRLSEHGSDILVPLAYCIEDAAAAIGVGRSTMYEFVKDGRIPARKIGSRTIIRRCDLEAFLDAAPLSAASANAQGAAIRLQAPESEP
jgi:excisionase family DNA binding protein